MWVLLVAWRSFLQNHHSLFPGAQHRSSQNTSTASSSGLGGGGSGSQGNSSQVSPRSKYDSLFLGNRSRCVKILQFLCLFLFGGVFFPVPCPLLLSTDSRGADDGDDDDDDDGGGGGGGGGDGCCSGGSGRSGSDAALQHGGYGVGMSAAHPSHIPDAVQSARQPPQLVGFPYFPLQLC